MNDAELKEQLELKKQQLTIDFQKVASIYQSNIAAIDSAIIVLDGKNQGGDYESKPLRDKILDAIQAAPMEFSIRDIARILAMRSPGKAISQQSIASSFWKIVTQELKLPLIREGAGNQPAMYRKLL